MATFTEPAPLLDPRPGLQPRRQHLEFTANGELILAGGHAAGRSNPGRVDILAATGIQADAVEPEASPIHRAGQPLQLAPGQPPEHSGVVGLGEERFRERNLQLSGFGGDVAGRHALFLQPQVNPRNEEQVAEPRLDRARPWKKVIGKRVADGAQPQLVTGFALLEHREDTLRAFPLGGVEVKPCEGGFHLVTPAPSPLDTPRTSCPGGPSGWRESNAPVREAEPDTT